MKIFKQIFSMMLAILLLVTTIPATSITAFATLLDQTDVFRITLTWNASPHDLDSHLEGEDSSGNAFHVYYQNKNVYDSDNTLLAYLDVDDTTGYGPENTTIFKSIPNKTFRFYVYNYSGERPINGCGAIVKLYKNDVLIGQYTAPANGGEGRYWNVFQILNGNVYVVNKIGNTSLSTTQSINVNANNLTENDIIITPKIAATDNGGFAYTPSNVRMKRSSSNTYEEQGDGSFIIDGSQPSTDSVTLVKEDYRNYIIPQPVLSSWAKIDLGTILLDNLSMPSISHAAFLQPDRKDGKPYISTVFAQKASLVQSAFANAYKEIQHESLDINKDDRYNVIISAEGLNGKACTYYIAQDQSHQISNTTGIFRSADLFSVLDFQKTTYAYVVTEDGVHSELMSINLTKKPDTTSDKLIDALKTGSISLLGKNTLSVKIPGSVPLLGDAEISLDAFKFPAGFEWDGNSLKVSIGANIFNAKAELKKDDPDKYEKWVKEFFKDWKESIKSITRSDSKDKNKKAAQSFKEKWGLGEKGKNKEKNWNVDFLGYLEFELIDGKWVTREAAISVEGSFSFEYTVQGAIWIIPTYFGLEAGCSVGATGTLSQVIADSSIPFRFDVTLKIAPNLELSAGVGYKKALSAGLYAEAKLPVTFEFRDRHLQIKVQGEIGVEARAFVFKGKKKLIDGTLNVLDKYFGTSSNQVSSTPATNAVADGEVEYTLVERDYLENTSGWLSGAPTVYSRRALLINGLSLSNLQTSVFEDAMPKVVAFGDKMLMTWVEDSAQRDAYNRMRLMYSVYDGATWSEPQPVCDDGFNDSTPMIATDGTDVYFAWQKLCKTLTESDLENVADITNYVEIFSAKYDAQSGAICNVRQETENNTYEYLHQISVIDGNANLFYVNCGDPETMGNNAIYRSDLADSTLCLAENLNYIVDLAVSQDDSGDIAVSYLMDVDADTITTGDINLYTYNPATETITDETAKILESLSASTRAFVTDIFYADFDGKSTLFAVTGKEVYHINTDGVGAMYVPDATISGDVNYLVSNGVPMLYWTSYTENANAVYCCSYKDGAWSAPVAVSDTGTILTGVTVVNYNETTRGVCTSTELIYDEGSDSYSIGQTNLCEFNIHPLYDVAVDTITIEEENIRIGETTAFSVYVQNNGSTFVDNLTFHVSDELGYSQSCQLEVDLDSGEGKFVELSYTAPENYGRTALTVSVDSDTYETNTDNNTVSKEIGLPKIVVSDATVYQTKNSYIISAFVTNESDVPAGSVTILSKLDEDVIRSSTVLETIPARGSSFVDFEIPASEIPFVDGSAKVFLSSENEDVLGNTVSVLLHENVTQCLHPVINEVLQEPTCVFDGLRQVICAGCEEIVEEQTIATNGHQFGFADTCSVCAAQRINQNEAKHIALPADQSIVSFVFTPDSGEEYCLYSDIPCNIVARIVDERTSEIYAQQFALDGAPLKLNYTFQQGIPYVLQFANASGIETTLPVIIAKLTPATDIVLTNTAVSGYWNTMQQLEVSFLPTNAITEPLEWSSSNPDCVTVDSSGSIYLKEIGTAIITVTSENGLTASLEVTVQDYPEILLDETKPVEITEGGQRATFRFTPEADGTYTFYSISDQDTYGYILDSNGNTLTADDDSGDGSNFRVEYALTGGETYLLQARFYGSQTGSFDVTLEKRPAAQAITITQGDTLKKYVVEDFYLNYTFSPEDCVAESATWTTSDITVADVYGDGWVDLIGPGTVTITVTSENGLTDSIEITVKEIPAILPDETKTVEITEGGQIGYYSFTPAEDGWYAFYSVSDEYTQCTLSDRYNYQLAYSSAVDGNNFRIEYNMTAGTTYIFKPGYYDSSATGSFDVKLEKMRPAESISIDQGDSLESFARENFALTYTLSPEHCAPESVTWTSSDETVASVSWNGWVTLLAPGTTTITVTSESGLTDTCTITVASYPTISAGQQATAEITDYRKNGYFYFTPEHDGTYAFYSISDQDTYGYILDSNGNTLTADDDSSDGSNFRVEYALTGGETYLLQAHFYSSNQTGNFDVKLVEVVVAQAIEITDGDTYRATRDSGHQLSVSFLPDGAREESVSWTSSDENIVSVDSSGYIYLYRPGSAVITATSANGLTDSITVEVTDYPAIELDQEVAVSIDSNTPTAAFSFVPAASGTYYFYSYNNSFDTYGYLYDADMICLSSNDDGGNGNNFYISYDLVAGEKYYFLCAAWVSGSGTCAVQLNKQPSATSIQIENGDTLSATVIEGTRYLYFSYSPSGSAWETVTWTSDNESVVTVDIDGLLTFVAPGTATVTVTSESGLTDSIVITVTDAPRITLDAGVTVTPDPENPYADLRFTPEEDGYYVFYSESDEDTYGYILDSNYNTLATNDDGGNGYNFQVGYFLYAGETYIMRARFLDRSNTGSFDVFLEKQLHITNLEILSLPDRMEYVKGFVSSIDYSGLTLRATWSDGTVTDWAAGNGYYIGGQQVKFNSSSAGSTGEIMIICGGQTVSFTLNLVDNPVDHLELVSSTEIFYVENQDGYFWGDDDEFFYYYTKNHEDAVIRIVYTDGTTATAQLGSQVDGYRISWEHYQRTTPWVVGSDNETIITYLGHTVILPITVIENPVESIEVISGKLALTEGIGGYMGYDGVFYYEYDLPDDIIVKVNYTDGTSKTSGINEELDGYWFDWYDLQEDEPWVVGDDNRLYVTYLDIEDEVPVTILPSPVERIEINTAPTRQYVYGDPSWGWMNDDVYIFYPKDLTGLSFTVYYTDGTQKTFTDSDIHGYKIDGYYYDLYYDEYDPALGEFPVTFYYMGRQMEYTVTLAASPLASISILSLPSVTEYGSYFEPTFTGTEFLLTYLNGTSKTVVLTEENLHYTTDDDFSVITYADIDGYRLMIYKDWDEDDEPYYRAAYMDQSVDISCFTFAQEDITAVRIDDCQYEAGYIDLTITYGDLHEESLHLDIFGRWDYGFEADCCAKTGKGLLYFYVDYEQDYYGMTTEYNFYLFGLRVTVPVDSPCAYLLVGDQKTMYMTLQEALEDWQEDAVLKLLRDVAEDVEISDNVVLDLNGCSILGDITVAQGNTLYIMDSRTSDFCVMDDWGYGTISSFCGNVQPVDGYSQFVESGQTSFHKIQLSVDLVTLRPQNAGIYYSASYRYDEIIERNLTANGVALSVANAMPVADGSDLTSLFTTASNSVLLKNIMIQGKPDHTNQSFANIPIYSRAYLKLSDGTFVYSPAVSTTLQDLVETVDAEQWSMLSITQKDGLADLYRAYRGAMDTWNIDHIKAYAAQ